MATGDVCVWSGVVVVATGGGSLGSEFDGTLAAVGVSRSPASEPPPPPPRSVEGRGFGDRAPGDAGGIAVVPDGEERPPKWLFFF